MFGFVRSYQQVQLSCMYSSVVVGDNNARRLLLYNVYAFSRAVRVDPQWLRRYTDINSRSRGGGGKVDIIIHYARDRYYVK